MKSLENLNILLTSFLPAPFTLSPYGSYKLGCTDEFSDLDVVCFSSVLDRPTFLSNFSSFLLSKNISATNISDAHIPIIKLHLNDTSIDLTYVQTDKEPDGIDTRIISGPKICDEILRLTPNLSLFRILLKAIKSWARSRQIHSNIFGYFGGMTWAILVSRIIQLYPSLSLPQLYLKFFTYCSARKWHTPIYLTEPIDRGTPFLVKWNPFLRLRDRSDLMPVLTPVCLINTTYNVCKFTALTLQNEFKRALWLLKTSNTIMDKSPIDEYFSTFIFLEVANPNLFPKIRKLLILLEDISEIKHARVFTSPLRIGLKFKRSPNKIDLSPIFKNFKELIEPSQLKITIN